MTSQYLYALGTLFFCLGIAWSCGCRLNLVRPGGFQLILRYSVLMTGAMVYGLAPILFQEWPGLSGLLLTGAVFGTMLLSLDWHFHHHEPE